MDKIISHNSFIKLNTGLSCPHTNDDIALPWSIWGQYNPVFSYIKVSNCIIIKKLLQFTFQRLNGAEDKYKY